MFEEIMNISAKFLLGIYMARDGYQSMLLAEGKLKILFHKIFIAVSVLFSVISLLRLIILIVNGI